MNQRYEAQMIPPICTLMRESMGLGVIAEEFSAGYGIADLVGASLCHKSLRRREACGFAAPLDQEYLVEVLLLLKSGIRHSLDYLSRRVSFSENLLFKMVLPQMEADELIAVDDDDYVRLLTAPPPSPTKNIVAVEAKQLKWREAILQARRYTFFANQTYIAVWQETASRVDRKLLYRHRLGLIGVGTDNAEIILEAPIRAPRQAKMSRYCSEFLYRKSLNERGD